MPTIQAAFTVMDMVMAPTTIKAVMRMPMTLTNISKWQVSL